MIDLIEIELTRVRRMAEHADDNNFLLYLLDMAILEANRRARSLEAGGRDAGETKRSEGDINEHSNTVEADLRIVR